MKCPYCDSENIHIEKQGFGFGKSLIGGILLGPLGLFCGAINKNKLMCTCLKCVRSFSVNEAVAAERKSLMNNVLGANEEETLYNKAIILIKASNKVSITYLQRELRIGYNKAAYIIEKLEKNKIITPPDEYGNRQIL